MIKGKKAKMEGTSPLTLPWLLCSRILGHKEWCQYLSRERGGKKTTWEWWSSFRKYFRSDFKTTKYSHGLLENWRKQKTQRACRRCFHFHSTWNKLRVQYCSILLNLIAVQRKPHYSKANFLKLDSSKNENKERRIRKWSEFSKIDKWNQKAIHSYLKK